MGNKNSSRSNLQESDFNHVAPKRGMKMSRKKIKTPSPVKGWSLKNKSSHKKEKKSICSRPLLTPEKTENSPNPLQNYLSDDERFQVTSSNTKSNFRKFVTEENLSSQTVLPNERTMSSDSTSDDEITKSTSLFVGSSFGGSMSNNSLDTNSSLHRDFSDPTGLFDLTPLNIHHSDAPIAVALCNETPKSISSNFESEDVIISGSSSPQPDSDYENIEHNNDESGSLSTSKTPSSELHTKSGELVSVVQGTSTSSPIPKRRLTFESETAIPTLSINNSSITDTETDSKCSDSSYSEAHPAIYHGNGLVGEEGDYDSLASESLLSCHSTDLESIGNISGGSCLSDLSLSSSIASLNLKRKRSRPQLEKNRSSPSIKRQNSGKRKNRKGTRPTASNAFETLPRHLIKSALVRQATTTLRDERFVQRRIIKLGPVCAAKIHVSDLMYLNKRSIKDARRRERLGTEEPTSDVTSFRDGEDATSVTLESFDLFQQSILELCSIEMVDLTVQCDLLEGSTDIGGESSSNLRKSNAPKISNADAGKAIYLLARCVHQREWNEEAMAYYRCSLFLFLLEMGIQEPCLLDDSDDCTGFYYVRIANMASCICTSVHKDLATLLTKMGDIHGKNSEINDALHSYRASQVFWAKYLSEKKITSVEDCENVSDINELDDHAAAIEGLALTHNRIGGVYCSKGDLEAAMKSFDEAIKMQIDALGPDHLEVAKTLHNIGVSHRHKSNLDQALEYYLRAYRIFELNLGKEHLDTVRTLHNIGGVYRRQKEYDKAMTCFRDVLKVRRTLLGDGHPSVAITLISIAAVLRRSGKEKEASKYYNAAMK